MRKLTIKIINQNYYKKISIFFFLLLIKNYTIYYNPEKEGKNFDKKPISLKINKFHDLFNNTIEKKTVLILEANRYHYECLPGYSKYFIDLGYKIDILSRSFGIDSFSLFNQTCSIHYFVFVYLNQLWRYSSDLISIIKKYDFVLIQTTNDQNRDLL